MLFRLADAAGAPRQTAAATATSAATAATGAAATAAAATAATATSAAAASAPRHLDAGSDVFLVEQVERRQADVGDFFFAECDGLRRSVLLSLRRVCCRNGGCGCTPYQRESQSGCTQSGHSGLGHTLAGHTLGLGGLLRHARILHSRRVVEFNSRAVVQIVAAACKTRCAHSLARR